MFNSSREGTLTGCMIHTAHCASYSKAVDIFKLRLTQYNSFYNSLIQQDFSQCFMMLIYVIRALCLSPVQITIHGVFFIWFLVFVYFKYIYILSATYVDLDPLHYGLVVCSLLHRLIALPCRNGWCNECNKLQQKSCLRSKNSTRHIESNHILQPSKYVTIIAIQFRYRKKLLQKIGAPYLWKQLLRLVPIYSDCRLP